VSISSEYLVAVEAALMGIYQLCRVIGEAGVELSSGEHLVPLKPFGDFYG
jgi:hypothetical protein